MSQADRQKDPAMRRNVESAPHAVLVVLGRFPDGTPRENTVSCYSEKDADETVSKYREWGQEAFRLY